MAQPLFSVSVETTPRNLSALWRKIPERLLAAWQKTLYAVVAQQGLKHLKLTYRSAPGQRGRRTGGITTATATAVRTGNLRANYMVSVPNAPSTRSSSTASEIDIGLMRRGYDNTGKGGVGEALHYGYVHEYGATIVPKPGNRRGRLMWKSPDGSWHSATQVRIPARPAIEPTVRYITPILRQRLEADAARLLKNPAANG